MSGTMFVRVEEDCEACAGKKRTSRGNACPICAGTGRRGKMIPISDLTTRVAKLMREREGDR